MKFFIAIILICATSASASPLNSDPYTKLDKILEECNEELNITLNNSNLKEMITEFKLPLDNAKGHCFVKCALEKAGLFDKDSGFKTDLTSEERNVYKIYPIYENLDIAYVKCAKVGNEIAAKITDDCERAYRGAECFGSELFKAHFRSVFISDYEKYNAECLQEATLKFSELEKDNAHNLSVVNSTLPCYVKCFYEKAGVFDKDNGLKVANLYDAFEISKLDPSVDFLANVEKCVNDLQQDVNSCERAYQSEDCLFNEVMKWVK